MLQSPSLMQHLSPGGIEPSWFDYPIVALAQRQASGDPLGTLERLSSLLAHVEAKCPTVDYVNLFESAHLDGLDASMLADQYRKLGVTEDADSDIFNDLFPGVDVSPQTVTDDLRIVCEDMRAQGFKLKDIAEATGRTVAGVWYMLNKKNRNPDVDRATISAQVQHTGSFRLELGPTEAAHMLGISRQRVYYCRKTVKEQAVK